MHVDEHTESAGFTRRDLLKRSVIVGGLVWVAPTVLASPASATVFECTESNRLAIRQVKNGTGATCVAVGKDAAVDGNCAAKEPVPPPTGVPGDNYSKAAAGCCLIDAGLITFTVSDSGNTHTYVLSTSVKFSQAFAYCKPGTPDAGCWKHEDPHNDHVVEDLVGGLVTVVVKCDDLVHSELIVCFTGSRPSNCH